VRNRAPARGPRARALGAERARDCWGERCKLAREREERGRRSSPYPRGPRRLRRLSAPPRSRTTSFIRTVLRFSFFFPTVWKGSVWVGAVGFESGGKSDEEEGGEQERERRGEGAPKGSLFWRAALRRGPSLWRRADTLSAGLLSIVPGLARRRGGKRSRRAPRGPRLAGGGGGVLFN
jgi:hypothetical protein